MTVVIGRVLGKSDLGLYVLSYSVVIILLELQNSFIASPYTINCIKLDQEAQARLTGNALALTVFLSLVCTFVITASTYLFPSAFASSKLRQAFVTVGVAALPMLVKEFGRRVCFAYLEVGRVLFIDSVASAVQLGGLLILTKWSLLSIRIVLILLATGSGIAGALWLVSWRRKIAGTISGAAETMRTTWSFGSWVLAGNLATVLSQQLFPWYLAFFKGQNATGAFAACIGLFALLNPIISAIGNYLGPATAAAFVIGRQEFSALILKATSALAGILGMFSLLAVVFGNHVLQVLYGSAYAVDVHVLLILAANLFVSNSTLALGFGFWAMGRPDINLKINAAAIIVGGILGPYLVRTSGLVGAAGGLLAAALAVFSLRIAVFISMIRQPRTEMFEETNDAR